MADVTWHGNDSTTPNDLSVGGNWSTSSVPTGGDHVRLVSNYTANMSAGMSTLSATTLGDVVVESGYTGSIGTISDPLDIICSRFEFNGGGSSHINLQSSSIDAIINDTSQNISTGQRGLYLTGTTLQTVSITGGIVGIAYQHGDTSSVTTLRVHNGDVVAGNGCTLTTVDVYGGNVVLNSNITTLNVYGGRVVAGDDCDITTLNIKDGIFRNVATGDITTANIDGGVLEMAGGIARTITNLNLNAGGGIDYDPAVVTVTNFNAPDAPVRIRASVF